MRHTYSEQIDKYLYINTDSALHYSKKLLELGLATDDSLAVGEGYEFIGNCKYFQSDIKGSLEYFEKAHSIYKKLDDSTYLGLIYVSFGNAYSDLGQLAKSLNYYEKAEKFLLAHSMYPEDLALLYYNMAQVFKDLGDLVNLEKYILKSKKILLAEKVAYLFPSINNIESYLAIEKNDLIKAEKLALLALKELKGQTNKVEQIFAFQNLAAINSKKNQYSKAIQFQDSALFHALRYGDESIIAAQTSSQAFYYLQYGNLIAADSLASESFQASERMNNMVLSKNTAWVFSKVLEAKGEYDKSLMLYKAHTHAKDSLQKFSLSEHILRSENLLTEQKNTLLNAETKLLKNRNAHNKLLITAAVLGLIFCLILIVLLVVILRNRKKSVKALNSKQVLLDQKSKELELKNVELEKMNRAKDKLFSIITHDLRQPFNQISSFIQILELTPDVDDSLKDLIIEMKESTNHTLSAMNNLLVWSKSQFLNVKTYPEKIDIPELIDSVISEMTSNLSEKKLNLNVVLEPNETLFADRNHVEIILRNLLSNAAKFSPIGGTLSINVERKDNSVEIAVSDEGKGMTNNEIERLFDAESHFSTPGTLNEKGSGLGMLIVSEFVKENNGTINVASQKNIGSTFKVVLPAA